MKFLILASLVAGAFGCAQKPTLPPPMTFKESIRFAIKMHMKEFEQCYNQALKRNKKSEGKIEVTWTIDSNGDVKDAKVSQSTVGDSLFETCTVNTLWAIKFAPPQKDQVAEVKYPFLFGAVHDAKSAP